MTSHCDRASKGSRLEQAREYEERFSGNIRQDERPVFHLPARIGWMNDPNGFSFYGGRYHLFYQYYPYDSKWGRMHWGHAASDDMLHWDFLPCALAPGEDYDNGMGCFSGSAVALPDGRHMLMYTGVSDAGRRDDGTQAQRQVQCLAFGDGVDYEKYEGNPVIDGTLLPEGLSDEHFRDPKMWQEEDGTFTCVVGALDKEKNLGRILRYTSPDGLAWSFAGILAENDGSTGAMWECPDTFELDGKQVLLVSPQDMIAEGNEFMSGNGTLCLIGHVDEQTGALVPETRHAIDYGIDFYATQTLLAPDGRRIMVAWMQNWDTISMADHKSWFGMMTLPRELSVRDGRLYQRPIRELDALRHDRVAYEGIKFGGELALEGISGRMADIQLAVRPADDEPYQEFAMWFAEGDGFHSSLRFSPNERILKINRKHSGLRRAVVYHRKCDVINYDGTLRLRVVLDRFSVEVFVGDGEQTLSMTIPTNPSADAITFFAEGKVVMDIEKFDLSDVGVVPVESDC